MLKLRYDIFGSEVLGEAKFDGKYEFPVVSGVKLNSIPMPVIPFDRVGSLKCGQWLHFYVHDRRFVNFLSRRDRYRSVIDKAGGFIGIDNSMYRDLPLAEQLHSCYLNRAVDYYLQKRGKIVVPNVSWGDCRSYDFCCDGIPAASTIAVSTYGCCRAAIDKSRFEDGFAFITRLLNPYSIVVYGPMWNSLLSLARHRDLTILRVPAWRACNGKEVR